LDVGIEKLWCSGNEKSRPAGLTSAPASAPVGSFIHIRNTAVKTCPRETTVD
jgi:hypothetical protein